MQISSRWFCITFMILLGVACQPQQAGSTAASAIASPTGTVADHREYEVHQALELVNEGSGQPEKQNLWVALIQDFPPYQDVLSMEVFPKNYKRITDEYGNQYAEFDVSDHPAGTTKKVEIDYRIAVNELVYDLSNCEGEVPDDFVQPELHIEASNPQIINLSDELSRDKETICEQIKAFMITRPTIWSIATMERTGVPRRHSARWARTARNTPL